MNSNFGGPGLTRKSSEEEESDEEEESNEEINRRREDTPEIKAMLAKIWIETAKDSISRAMMMTKPASGSRKRGTAPKSEMRVSEKGRKSREASTQRKRKRVS